MLQAVCGDKAEIYRNMNLILQLTEYIELSLLPKLSKNYDESEKHLEYDVRLKNIDYHFPLVLKLLEEVNLKDKSGAVSSILSTLFIMYKELQSEGPWNNERSKDFASKLNSRFQQLYEITLDDVLKENEIFDQQGIFDKCVDNLHRKLTSDDYKKYPGRINVYCSLIQGFQDYKVSFNAMLTFPVTLLLVDDYILANKIQGIKCCRCILKSLTAKDFENGNYYEIIYVTLVKTLTEKDLEVTKLSHECCLDLLELVPSVVRTKKLNDIFFKILEETNLECKLLRTEACLQFLKSIIKINGVNCVRGKKLFMSLAIDNLELCTSFGNRITIGDKLLQAMIECLEEWLRNCWCVWKLSTDQKLLTVLIKILYLMTSEDNIKAAPEDYLVIVTKVQNLIIALISLCSKEERKKLTTNLEKTSQVPNAEFLKIIKIIQQELSTCCE